MMKNSTWIFDITSIVFTRLQYKVSKKLKTEFPNIQFTTSSVNQITKFPTIFFNEMQGNEIGRNLDNDVINGVNASYQVEIYSDKSQEVCRKIAKEVVTVMKDLHFTSTTPIFQNESTTYRLILMFNRSIGSEDIL